MPETRWNARDSPPAVVLVPHDLAGLADVLGAGAGPPGQRAEVVVREISEWWVIRSGLATARLGAGLFSVCVHTLPSLQVTPLGLTGLEQTPVAGAQVPGVWHWSEAVQTFGAPLAHAPARQLSASVQALPSLQVVPSSLLVWTQGSAAA